MLSVIIPAFNEELMIERAYFTISNILKNAEIENEIIFIDDGSTDNTFEKIKSFAVIKEGFSVENGLLSSTAKVKRNKVFERFSETIKKMYK